MTIYTSKQRIVVNHPVTVKANYVTGGATYTIMCGPTRVRTYANANAAFALVQQINKAFLEGQKIMSI